MMRTADFDFDLPAELIAQEPVSPRDSSRLLHIGGGLTDYYFRDIIDLLKPDDVLVMNNTKVIPARLRGTSNGKDVSVTLHKLRSVGQWEVFAKPMKKLPVGATVIFADDFKASVLAREGNMLVIDFAEASHDAMMSKIIAYGEAPLPPYIKRHAAKEEQQSDDKQSYQTLFAKEEGAVAAPTAGLHFTEELLKAVADKGVRMVYVTLHVGGGTFLPVTAEHIDDHIMHSEFGMVSDEAANLINEAKNGGARIVALGTTSLRLLESAYCHKQAKIDGFHGETSIFMTPGFTFQVADALITNFHTPKSTLFMLVCAFTSMDIMRQAYQHAIEQSYRFFSYGDACFIERGVS